MGLHCLGTSFKINSCLRACWYLFITCGLWRSVKLNDVLKNVIYQSEGKSFRPSHRPFSVSSRVRLFSDSKVLAPAGPVVLGQRNSAFQPMHNGASQAPAVGLPDGNDDVDSTFVVGEKPKLVRWVFFMPEMLGIRLFYRCFFQLLFGSWVFVACLWVSPWRFSHGQVSVKRNVMLSCSCRNCFLGICPSNLTAFSVATVTEQEYETLAQTIRDRMSLNELNQTIRTLNEMGEACECKDSLSWGCGWVVSVCAGGCFCLSSDPTYRMPYRIIFGD